MRGINAAAAVTPINLLATTCSPSPRGALPESALLRQLELYLKLLRAWPYGPRVTVTDATPGRNRASTASRSRSSRGCLTSSATS